MLPVEKFASWEGGGNSGGGNSGVGNSGGDKSVNKSEGRGKSVGGGGTGKRFLFPATAGIGTAAPRFARATGAAGGVTEFCGRDGGALFLRWGIGPMGLVGDGPCRVGWRGPSEASSKDFARPFTTSPVFSKTSALWLTFSSLSFKMLSC